MNTTPGRFAHKDIAKRRASPRSAGLVVHELRIKQVHRQREAAALHRKRL
jgi:hypothetical protein